MGKFESDVKIMNGQVNGKENAEIMKWKLFGEILYVIDAVGEAISRGTARHRKEQGKAMARTAVSEARAAKAMARMAVSGAKVAREMARTATSEAKARKAEKVDGKGSLEKAKTKHGRHRPRG